MKFEILTIFPKIFDSYFSHTLLARAQKKRLISIKIHDLRKWATDKHGTVDDRPYGGGVGMVMKVDIVAKALNVLANSKFEIRNSKQASKSKFKKSKTRTRIILLTPQGKPFTQKEAKRLNQYYGRLVLVSGRYEGYDERIRGLVDEEISIGDYVLTGGELAAMVVVDTVARLVPGVVGKKESLVDESFSRGELEYPHYTRPAEFDGKKVPKVLRSGNHKEIEKWRREEAKKRTMKRRPDLFEK